jgi:hypothetical protein
MLDDSKERVLVEQEHKERYQLVRKPHTIEVYDRIDKTRFTICLV